MEEALRLAPSCCRCSSAAPSLPAGRVPRRSAQGGPARPRGSQARARTTRLSIEQGSRPTRRRAVWGARFVSQKSRKATRTTLRLQRPAKTLVRLLREALTGSCASCSPGFSISRLQVERSDLVRSTHALWAPAPSKPLETTGERGANCAPPVRRVALRIDLSNARS